MSKKPALGLPKGRCARFLTITAILAFLVGSALILLTDLLGYSLPLIGDFGLGYVFIGYLFLATGIATFMEGRRQDSLLHFGLAAIFIVAAFK